MLGLSLVQLIMMSVGTILLLLWLVVFAMSGKYAQLFQTLNEKEYPLKEIYCFGYCLLEKIHYGYRRVEDQKMRQEISIFYEKKYAEYYLRVIYAQKVTYAATLFVLAFILYGLTNEIIIFFLLLLFAGLAFYYYGNQIHDRIQKRSQEMISDFSEVVSKLALLTNAGMIMREAWEYVANTNDTTIYQEMKRTVDEMKNGVSETEAFREFGNRCVLPQIKKFTATIVQGMVKGNSELVIMLQQQSSEVWNAKRQSVKQLGEAAESKLMLPMCIMFVGVLVMVVIPIFTNIGA